MLALIFLFGIGIMHKEEKKGQQLWQLQLHCSSFLWCTVTHANNNTTAATTTSCMWFGIFHKMFVKQWHFLFSIGIIHEQEKKGQQLQQLQLQHSSFRDPSCDTINNNFSNNSIKAWFGICHKTLFGMRVLF